MFRQKVEHLGLDGSPYEHGEVLLQFIRDFKPDHEVPA